MKLYAILLCMMLLLSGLSLDLKAIAKTDLEVSNSVLGDKCTICKKTIGKLADIFLNPIGIKLFEHIFYSLISSVFSPEQSWTIVEAYTPIIMNDMKVKTFEPGYFCEVVLPLCPANDYSIFSIYDYAESIKSDKPDFLKNDDYVDNLYKEIEQDAKNGVERETITMYHISDLHMNLNYTEGASNDCGQIVCCVPGLKPPQKESERAGKWGDYKCDANPKILDQFEHAIKETGKPDFVVWTGDSPDHGIYKDPAVTTKASNTITEFFKTHSPNTTIFPIHGNHEFDPMNVQNFNLEDDPVIEIVSESWKNWLPEYAYNEYRNRSFYSVLASDHPNTSEDFHRKMNKTRIIGLNSQNCYIYNFYLIGQRNDPGQQMEWLENLLREMEQNNETAIVIAHMSPGTFDCISEVSYRLKALYDRFQHIIRLSLFGHTHYEEFEVVRSLHGNKPIHVNHVTSSMTTHVDMNPSFRVITLDAKTKLPVKIETYRFDVDKANKDDSEAYFKYSHEMKKTYNMTDLSPSSFLTLAENMKDDVKLAEKYKYFKETARWHTQECDSTCRKIQSCMTSNSVFSEARDCLGFTGFFKADFLLNIIFETVINKWVRKA